LIETIISSLPQAETPVEGVIQGPRYTMVISGQCGIAAVPRVAVGTRKTPASIHTGRPLRSLLPLAASSDPAEAGLGIAAINALALTDFDPSSFQPGSMPRAGGKTVGLVGDFAFAPQLESLAAKVIKIEDDAGQGLSNVDIAIIAGSTIVEHRLEHLLRSSASTYTIIYGPSTPLSPVLFEYGADQLVGVRVIQHEKAAESVASGANNLMECPGVKTVVLRRWDTARGTQ
jgi:uncharacterized protein (DUF4213/DUF364 family)